MNPTPTTTYRTEDAPPAYRRFLARLLLMALIWLGLNGTDLASWTIGAPVAVAAAWVSLKLLPASSWRCSLVGALCFAGFFIRESLRGGWDVARHALSPRLQMSPAIVCYQLRLPTDSARLFFCSAISLLPGTAVVGIEGSSICIHVLDHSPRVEEELRELEERVGAIFGLGWSHGDEVTT